MVKGNTKVLFVDSDNKFARELRAYLDNEEPIPFTLTHVKRTSDALQNLSKISYQLILLHISPPNHQGYNTFREIHNQAPEVPIVIVSSQLDIDLALQVLREGAQDFLINEDVNYPKLVRTMQYALERHKILEKAKRLALVDDLTGLLNRRGFTSMASQHIKIAKRSNTELLLFFADMDGLKQINDQFGHPEGDQALKDISRILRNTFRSSDLIARIGGDEFTVLAIDAPHVNAEAILARLYKNIRKQNATNPLYQLSLSVGVSRSSPEDGDVNLKKMMIEADRALYEHKRKSSF